MKQLIPALFVVGAVMLLIGAAVYVTGWQLSPYIYTVGATFVALAQINSPSQYKTPTIRRLRRQQIFGALLLVLTGAFMFFTRGNEWIVSLTIAAILELYTSIRIPQEEAKEQLLHENTRMVFIKKKAISPRQPIFLLTLNLIL